MPIHPEARRSSPHAAARRRASEAKLRSLRKLQGQYMGLVRNLKPKQKAQIRAIREKQGYEAAIRRARRFAARGRAA